MNTTPPPMPRCQYTNVQHQRRHIGDVFTRDQLNAYRDMWMERITALESTLRDIADYPDLDALELKRMARFTLGGKQ